MIVDASPLGIACANAGERVSRVVGNRSLRVITLVLMIAVMSIVDLYLTLLYVTHTGMNEINPIARAMMEYRSPGVLALWKTSTVVLSLGILIVIRRRRSAEFGAWIGCFILGWLMIQWTGFIHLSEEASGSMLDIADPLDPSWIMIEADAGIGNLVFP